MVKAYKKIVIVEHIVQPQTIFNLSCEFLQLM